MPTARRPHLLVMLGALAVGGVSASAFRAPAETLSVSAPLPSVLVYKSPTCGCCRKWVDHLKQAGFTVTTRDMDDLTELKTELGVAPKLASCHTAVVDGYVIEGHVPADLVQKLLKERPKIAGLAAPGMPQKSPGMDMPVQDKYDIIAFDKTGKTSVYATR